MILPPPLPPSPHNIIILRLNIESANCKESLKLLKTYIIRGIYNIFTIQTTMNLKSFTSRQKMGQCDFLIKINI